MNRTTEKFLSVLGLQAERPSHDFLKRLAKAHLLQVPYENVSKVVRFAETGAVLPSYEEHVDGLERYAFGGTCFALNAYFARLLSDLGFEVELVPARVNGQVVQHVGVRINVEGKRYIVDLGMMGPFSGPFSLEPGALVEIKSGDQTFVYSAGNDGLTYMVRVLRRRELLRYFDSLPNAVEISDMSQSIRETYSKDAYFMKTLAVYRHFEDRDVSLWNSTLYTVRGSRTDVRILANLADLESALKNDFQLPQYPIKRALMMLQEYGDVDVFTQREKW